MVSFSFGIIYLAKHNLRHFILLRLKQSGHYSSAFTKLFFSTRQTVTPPYLVQTVVDDIDDALVYIKDALRDLKSQPEHENTIFALETGKKHLESALGHLNTEYEALNPGA